MMFTVMALNVASLAAGNNQISNGAYTGVAPNASLINLRVLNSQGSGATSNVLAALDWVLLNHEPYNIRVVNLSIGTPAIDSYLDDPLCQAVRRVTDAGIVVVAAAGNNGKDQNGAKVYGQIHAPGNEPSAVTVGAANSFGTDARGDDSITTYSSRGPTRSFTVDDNGVKHYDNVLKPDLVAPGNKLVGAAASANYLLATHPELDAEVSSDDAHRMMYLSGSSMSAPIAAGAAAILLQANPSLTPSLVKAILMFTAQPLPGSNTFEQGAGEINIEGALRLARLVRTDLSTSTALGAPLLTGAPPVKQTIIGGQTFGWGAAWSVIMLMP
jgi:subtilisin family serine protease